MTNTTSTNVFELRGSILSVIANIENEQYLRQILLQIQPFLKGAAEIEGGLPQPKKSKRLQKKGKSPLVAQEAPTTLFVKKYASQPTPEEADKVLNEMLRHKAGQISPNSKSFLQTQTWTPISEKEWVRRAEALQIEEPIEELLALLSK